MACSRPLGRSELVHNGGGLEPSFFLPGLVNCSRPQHLHICLYFPHFRGAPFCHLLDLSTHDLTVFSDTCSKPSGESAGPWKWGRMAFYFRNYAQVLCRHQQLKLWSQATWVQILVLSLSDNMTLGKSFKPFSSLSFLLSKMGVLIIVLPCGVVAKIKWHNVCKHLAHCLAHNRAIKLLGRHHTLPPVRTVRDFSSSHIWSFQQNSPKTLQTE